MCWLACWPENSPRNLRNGKSAAEPRARSNWQPSAYASIVFGTQLTRRLDGLTLRLLLVDVARAAIAVYAACLLTAEILATSRSGAAAVTAYATAAMHGATVAIRRLAPRAAVAGLLVTAGFYALAL